MRSDEMELGRVEMGLGKVRRGEVGLDGTMRAEMDW